MRDLYYYFLLCAQHPYDFLSAISYLISFIVLEGMFFFTTIYLQFGVNGTQGFLYTTFTLHTPLFFLPIIVSAIYKVVVLVVSITVKNSGNIPLPLKNPLLLIKLKKFNRFLNVDMASFCRLGLKDNARMSWCTIESDPGKLFSII